MRYWQLRADHRTIHLASRRSSWVVFQGQIAVVTLHRIDPGDLAVAATIDSSYSGRGAYPDGDVIAGKAGTR